VNHRSNRKRAENFGFALEEFPLALFYPAGLEVVLRQPIEEHVVLGFRSRDLLVENLEGAGLQGVGDQAEALAAPGFDDPTDQQAVEEIILGSASDFLSKPLYIKILFVGHENESRGLDQPDRLMEMLEFLPRQKHHVSHQLRSIGVVADHGEGRGRSLPLTTRVIKEEGVEVGEHDFDPFSWAGNQEFRHGGVSAWR